MALGQLEASTGDALVTRGSLSVPGPSAWFEGTAVRDKGQMSLGTWQTYYDLTDTASREKCHETMRHYGRLRTVQRYLDGASKLLFMMNFHYNEESRKTFPIGVSMAPLLEDMSCVDPKAVCSVPFKGGEANMVWNLVTMRCATFTQELLGCGNIVVEGVPSEMWTRKRWKAEGDGLARPCNVEFKTLRIVRPKHSASAGNGEAPPQSARRYHICRGHISDYTKGNGLFGKYKGKFYIPQHWRGDASAGRIEKDYEVVTGERES
jgi:hypothetical protein